MSRTDYAKATRSTAAAIREQARSAAALTGIAHPAALLELLRTHLHWLVDRTIDAEALRCPDPDEPIRYASSYAELAAVARQESR